MAGDSSEGNQSIGSISLSDYTTMAPVNIPVKMPSPRSKTAPRFNGKNLTEFVNEYNIHAKAAMLDKEEKAKLLMSYLSTKIKRTVEDLPEFKANEWDKMLDPLNRLYYSADHKYKPSQSKFREFVKDTRKFRRLRNQLACWMSDPAKLDLMTAHRML